MVNEKIIQQGAEAVLIRNGDNVLKRRVAKGYRLKELDEKLRKSRTKKEAKLLEKAGKLICVPRVLKVNERDKELDIEFIDGLKLSDNLDSMKNWKEVCFAIGRNIALLHDAGIIHGDLTTSNMIWVSGDFFPHHPLPDHPPQSLSCPPTLKRDLNLNSNFRKQLAELKKLNFPEDEYAVFGSGPLAVRGIKDSNDIDIVTKQVLWNKIAKKYVVKKAMYGNVIKIGSIEIYEDWKPWFEELDKLIDDADIFEGIRFVKLEHVLAWKKVYNREKDKKDFQLIEEYLSKQKGRLYFIDFGLGFENGKTEDKAVDLYLIKEALEAKHFEKFKEYFAAVLGGYKSSKNWKEVLNRLEKVEKRGRYKGQY